MPTLVINNDTYHEAQIQRLRRLGPRPRNFKRGCNPPLFNYTIPSVLLSAVKYLTLIPRELWKPLIEATAGQTLHDLAKDQLPPHDQGNTNYCWAHGATRTVELTNLYQTGIAQLLSAESVAVPVTGGRNRGGSADEALQRLITHGACHQDLWPPDWSV